MSTQDQTLIDDAFYVVKERFLYQSFDKEGKRLVAGLTEESVIQTTRFYLKGTQDGWDEETSRVVNDGVVGGKL